MRARTVADLPRGVRSELPLLVYSVGSGILVTGLAALVYRLTAGAGLWVRAAVVVGVLSLSAWSLVVVADPAIKRSGTLVIGVRTAVARHARTSWRA